MESLSRAVTVVREHGRLVAALVVLVGLGLATTVLVPALVPRVVDPVALRAWVRSFGAWAPAAFVLLAAGQVVLAPVPGQVTAAIGGFLFGVLAGTTYGLLGAAVGTYVAMRLARRFGRPFVERVVPAETVAEFDAATREHGLLALFVVFLVPGLPDDAICFLAGVSDVDVRKAVVVSILGRAPGFLLSTVAGAGVATGQYVVVGAALGVLAAASVLAVQYRERLLRWLGPRA
jgi:uncharacterized membrane protein YdjX (TVP38/TMEM64 family)